ncbi:putative RNA-binding protein 39 isoform X7 [Penaeus vannamei]|uniref:Putative RNA-binding protein 39 isoform X7 n=1 Tax=Penaeus vannamei TaxID=6689 RepID=A0A423S9F2_PENVA|nr:putative RNA-binding protein 39 isoform X7 [Penaeus vannamei]
MRGCSVLFSPPSLPFSHHQPWLVLPLHRLLCSPRTEAVRRRTPNPRKMVTHPQKTRASPATGGRKRVANPETEIERSLGPGLGTRTGGKGLDQDQKIGNEDHALAAVAKVAAGIGAVVGVVAGTGAAVKVVVENAGGEAAVETGGGAAVESVDVHALGVKHQNCKELSVEERDARTVFCMQLSSRIRSRDLEDFFSVVGKVNDVRIITDAKTRRSKGIAYVEFVDVESVPLALGLSGQKILGVPIVCQPTQAEKNRAANTAAVQDQKAATGPMRLYVGSLHFNITEDMLRGIFEPFGKIDHIQLIMDSETGRSKGYGFITFHNSDDAKKALEQLNGFELAGRPMKVNHVTERSETQQGTSLLDSDEMERAGIDLGATGRLQLMAKLAEGTGLQLPAAAANALHMPAQPQQQPAPPIATQCFLLSNMFDPSTETNPNWADEIRDDVLEECNKHGGVLHVFVDRQSAQGNVYVKCPTIATAAASVNALHGRWFAGKMITAAYVPVMSYHSLFPEAMNATQLIYPR